MARFIPSTENEICAPNSDACKAIIMIVGWKSTSGKFPGASQYKKRKSLSTFALLIL